MQTLQGITEETIENLRKEVSAYIGNKRFSHTLGVEKMAQKIGQLLLPSKKNELCIAALLHDITKEFSDEEQIALCQRYSIRISAAERSAMKTLHAKTGAYFAKEHFPKLVTDEMFHAIYRHTTGASGMSVFDEIIFLSDLIEDGRKYPLSIDLRNEFFDKISKKATQKERLFVLHETVFKAISSTIQYLIQGRSYIATATLSAYNFLKSKIKEQ